MSSLGACDVGRLCSWGLSPRTKSPQYLNRGREIRSHITRHCRGPSLGSETAQRSTALSRQLAGSRQLSVTAQCLQMKCKCLSLPVSVSCQFPPERLWHRVSTAWPRGQDDSASLWLQPPQCLHNGPGNPQPMRGASRWVLILAFLPHGGTILRTVP